MNAVEIEQAITDLAEQPFDREHFPYAFLEAFGNKETTIKRLRAGASNKSDLVASTELTSGSGAKARTTTPMPKRARTVRVSGMVFPPLSARQSVPALQQAN